MKENEIVGIWIIVKDSLSEEDGNYLCYLKTPKMESIGFTMFQEGCFMSQFVTHWTKVIKPKIHQ